MSISLPITTIFPQADKAYDYLCQELQANFYQQEKRGGPVHLDRFLHFLSGKTALVTLPEPLLAA